MRDINEHTRLYRKSFACDECKRRKIRCSGGDRCANCSRDAKLCRYSSPSQRLVSLQRRLRESEDIRRNIQRAWKIYLPDVDLDAAIRDLPRAGSDAEDGFQTPVAEHDVSQPGDSTPQTAPVPDEAVSRKHLPPSMEHTNAEDYEFDESHDTDGSIDGMASLTSDPHKAGYTGPQSGIAALKFLQSLPPYQPITYASPLFGTEKDIPDAAPPSPEAIKRAIDDYFTLYHPAYPILHEGTFRARVTGALAKPRDGSWPILYNAVLAIGTFVGGPNATQNDFPFFREARRHLSMDMLERGSLGYVQALTILANYMQKRDKPNAGFILIGIAFSMAQAIGLHREFDTSNTSPFTMEIRRRAWWTLFVFVSGAQLTLGRPAASLVGVTVELPTNLDDLDVAVDMEQLPAPKEHPTISSCLIEHVKLAKIANRVHDELLTHHRLSHAKAMKLEENIRDWWDGLPPYFVEVSILEPRFELPKRVLLWRSMNLRIVLNRPTLFDTIASGAELSNSDGPVKSCIEAASESVASICGFIKSIDMTRRGFAWYSTSWLVTACFVHATCLIYSPTHPLAEGWTASLQQAVECLRILGSSVDIALRAIDIIQNVLENRSFVNLPSSNPMSGSTLANPRLNGIPEAAALSMDLVADSLPSMWSEDRLSWVPQGQDSGEFLGAAGGFMYGNIFDVS